MTPTDQLACVKYALAGRDPSFIAAAIQQPEPAVRVVLEKYGYPDKDKLAWAVDEFERDVTRLPDKTPPAPPAGYRDPGRVAPAVRPASPRPTLVGVASSIHPSADPLPTVQVGLGAILERAKNSGRPTTRRLAEKIDALVLDLTTRLKAEDEVEADRIRKNAAREAAQAKVNAAKLALEQAIEEARTVIGAPAPKTRLPARTTPFDASGRPSGSAANAQRMQALGVTAAELRDWARASAVDCPAKGSVPARVIDAYEAARLTTEETAS